MSNNSLLNQNLALPCGAVLSNRFGKSAMTEGLADKLDNATEQHVNRCSVEGCGFAGCLLRRKK